MVAFSASMKAFQNKAFLFTDKQPVLSAPIKAERAAAILEPKAQKNWLKNSSLMEVPACTSDKASVLTKT